MQDMEWRNIFLRQVEAYLLRTGASASAFGEEVVGDRAFVFNLRRGCNTGIRTIDVVRLYMRQHPKALGEKVIECELALDAAE